MRSKIEEVSGCQHKVIETVKFEMHLLLSEAYL